MRYKGVHTYCTPDSANVLQIMGFGWVQLFCLLVCDNSLLFLYHVPLQRRAHPQGLHYTEVAPPPPDSQGSGRNWILDEPPTKYATILPHIPLPADGPRTGQSSIVVLFEHTRTYVATCLR